MRSFRLLFLFSITTSGLVSCGSLRSSPRLIQKVEAALMAGKTPSLQSWTSANGQKAKVLKTAEAKTAMLLGGMQATVSSRRTPRGTIACKYVLQGKNSDSVSTAFPISTDGYFLTCSHCLEPRPLTLLALETLIFQHLGVPEGM